MSAPAIVIPLYIYPSPGAWDPLIRAAQAQPDVQFVGIINPNSGPGVEPLPDANYQKVLTDLCQISNIQLLGYVHADYGKRKPGTIKSEIDRYSDWGTKSSGAFSVQGIFIDEVPADSRLRRAMADLATHIRTSFAGRGVVVYNPGVVVDPGFLKDADRVVVFEESQHKWYDYFMVHGLSRISPHLRPKAVAMVHSFGKLPASVQCDTKLAAGDGYACTALVDQIRALGFGGLYVTDQVGGGFHYFPKTWKEQVAACAKGAKSAPRI